jgi:hypothetical protein
MTSFWGTKPRGIENQIVDVVTVPGDWMQAYW